MAIPSGRRLAARSAAGPKQSWWSHGLSGPLVGGLALGLFPSGRVGYPKALQLNGFGVNIVRVRTAFQHEAEWCAQRFLAQVSLGRDGDIRARRTESKVDVHWRSQAGVLDWSCWETAAHVAHDLLAYAGQLAAQPDDGYLPFDLVVRDGASPHDLLRIVTGAGWLLSNALAVADRTIRAWHWGPTDPSGFAALGVNETLVHTHDITEGLGIRWHPPESLCGAVLARLFPDAPAGDPAQVLLWSTGRTELPGHPRITSWVLKAAVE